MRGRTLLIGAVTLSLGACSASGAPSAEQNVTTALRDLQRAVADRDYATLCASMTTPALRQVTAVAHGTPDGCKIDMQQAFDLLRPVGGEAGSPPVTQVSVQGERAIAQISSGPAWHADVPLLRQAGKWKLDSFFGLAEPQARSRTAEALTRGFPAGEDIAARTMDGRPCPPFSGAGDHLRGGCRIVSRVFGIDIPHLTPFGRIGFRDCRLDFKMRVDSRGRTWTQMKGEGPPGNGCDDILGCGEDVGEARPWPGRILRDRDGGFSHIVDACFDSCIGFYAGPMRMTVEPSRGGWRIVPREAVFATTGLRFTPFETVRAGTLSLN